MRPPSRTLFIRMLAIALAAVGTISTIDARSFQQTAFVHSIRPCRVNSATAHVQQAPSPTDAVIGQVPSASAAVQRRSRYIRQRAVLDVAAVEKSAESSTVGVDLADGVGVPSAGVWSAAPNDPTFRQLYGDRLPEWLLARLEELGFTAPTLVQREALGVILGDGEEDDKNDAVIHAQTGSGKTLAFLLPLFAALDPSRAAVQALVVVPTRELGLQVAGVAKRLAAAKGGTASANSKRIQIMSVLEGSSNKRQRAWAWAEPPHVVIGNPDNLNKLVTRGAIRVNAVEYVVVDEVDACLLSEGTRASLHELLARSLSPTHAEEGQAREEEEAASLAAAGTRIVGPQVPVVRKLANRQTVFASATVPQHNHFIKQCIQKRWTLTEPVHVQVHGKEAMPPGLSHFYVVCSPEHKLSVLRALVKRELGSDRADGADSLDRKARALVFAQKTKPLEQIAGSLHVALGGEKYNTGGECGGGDGGVLSPPLAEYLLEELGLNRRADTMSLFREGHTRLLVATDMAARGLDVPEISHIFNLDLPMDGEGYVHRGGRAGRLGRPGKIVSIITPSQEFAIRRLGNGIGVDIKKISLGKKSAGVGK